MIIWIIHDVADRAMAKENCDQAGLSQTMASGQSRATRRRPGFISTRASRIETAPPSAWNRLGGRPSEAMRDAIAAGSDKQGSTVASVVESGLRNQGAALSDGIGALREVVAPFAGEGCPSAIENCPHDAPPCDAAAPFSRS